MHSAEFNNGATSFVSPFTEVVTEPAASPFEVVDEHPGAKVHPTAIIESGVRLGEGTSVWDNAHIRENASLGEQCIVGGKATIAYDVHIGNRVKINSQAYICNGVSLGDGVMVSAGVIFTNDRYPRAATPDLSQLHSSEPDDDTLTTWVHQGVTIGAGAIIGGGIEIGAFAMIGMGSVVTRAVGAFHLVLGNPARPVGTVCRCGQPTFDFGAVDPAQLNEVVQCRSCGMRYHITGGEVREFNPPQAALPAAPATEPEYVWRKAD